MGDPEQHRDQVDRCGARLSAVQLPEMLPGFEVVRCQRSVGHEGLHRYESPMLHVQWGEAPAFEQEADRQLHRAPPLLTAVPA